MLIEEKRLIHYTAATVYFRGFSESAQAKLQRDLQNAWDKPETINVDDLIDGVIELKN